MKEFFAKLKSRKLWTALAGLAAGIAVVFGISESAVHTIAGAAVAITSVVAYIVTEGRIDAAALTKLTPELKELLELLADDEEGEQ